MLTTTKAYLCSAFMHWAGIEDITATPSNIKLPPVESSSKQKNDFIMETIGKFVDEFVMVEFDVEEQWRQQQEQKVQQAAGDNQTSSCLPEIKEGSHSMKH